MRVALPERLDRFELHGDRRQRMRQRIVQLARHAIPLAADRELLGRRGVRRQLLMRDRERCLLHALLLQQPADAHGHERHCGQSGNREDKEQRIEHSAGTVEWEAQRKITDAQNERARNGRPPQVLPGHEERDHVKVQPQAHQQQHAIQLPVAGRIEPRQRQEFIGQQID